MAQWIAHWTSNPEVAGSNPVKSVYINKAADLSSVILGCVGSNPTSGMSHILSL